MPSTTTDFITAVEGAALGHQYRLRARLLPELRWPVPTLQPLASQQPIALDLQPLGPNPWEAPGNGYTWVDCCNADVMQNNNAPLTCGRLGIKTINGKAAGYVGTVVYNGAPHGNFWIETGGEPRWGATFAGDFIPFEDNEMTLGLPENRVLDVHLTSGSLQAKLNELEARLAALENN